METKQQIRKRHLQMRDGLMEDTVLQNSCRIVQKAKDFLAQRECYQTAGVYGYYPRKKEASLLELYAWLLKQSVPLAFPKVSGDAMEFYQVFSMEDFEIGGFQVMEPVQGCKKAGFEQAFCFVPGSVFDCGGVRYGYGKGYYDRYFSMHKDLHRIGIAYESQVEEHIPATMHDVLMQALITEKSVRFFA